MFHNVTKLNLFGFTIKWWQISASKPIILRVFTTPADTWQPRFATRVGDVSQAARGRGGALMRMLYHNGVNNVARQRFS
jgi:hypothetical protein